MRRNFRSTTPGKIVRPPVKQKSHQYSFAWRKQFLQNLWCSCVLPWLDVGFGSRNHQGECRSFSDANVMFWWLANVGPEIHHSSSLDNPEDIVGTFRKELEHRMMLQDLKIDAWFKGWWKETTTESTSSNLDRIATLICVGQSTFILSNISHDFTHIAQQNPKEMSDLYVKAVVGRGSFGLVKLVYHKRDKQLGWKSQGSQCIKVKGPTLLKLSLRQKYYALKCIGKKQVVQQKQEKSMLLEREINSQCYHPCIMHFITTFQARGWVFQWMWCHVDTWVILNDTIMMHDAVDSVSVPGHQECLLLDRVFGWWWLVHSHPRHWKSQ